MHSFSFHMETFSWKSSIHENYVNETLLNDNQIIPTRQLNTILETQYLITSEEGLYAFAVKCHYFLS